MGLWWMWGCGSYSGGRRSGRTSSVRVCHVKPLKRSGVSEADVRARSQARVELTNGARGVLAAAHEDVAVPPTAVVGSEAHVGTQYCAGLSKQVLEILPAYAVWKLAHERCTQRERHAQSTHVANKEVYAPV